MIEIETTATFPKDKNVRFFLYLLSQNDFTNYVRSGLSVTVSYDGHGSRQVLHHLVEQCFGTVRIADEKFGEED